MQHIETVTLAGTQSSITFSSIPQTFTDLFLVYSVRTNQTSFPSAVRVAFNGNTANFTGRYLEGSGSSAASGSLARYAGAFYDITANTFTNHQMYIPNYASAVAKSFSVDAVTESNTSQAYQDIIAGLWNDTAAITSITLSVGSNSFVQYSSASLYGILAGSDGIVSVS